MSVTHDYATAISAAIAIGRGLDPAVPRDPPDEASNIAMLPQTGMSLRQWYKGQALAGFLADHVNIAAATTEADTRHLSLDLYLGMAAGEIADGQLAEDREHAKKVKP